MFRKIALLILNSAFLFGMAYNITKNSKNQNTPFVAKDIIVWQDYRDKNSDIYLYNLKTKTTQKITSNPDYDGNPITNGDYVLYESSEGGNYFLNLYNIATKERVRITDKMTNGYSIYGNYVVWAENSALFLYDISLKAKTLIIKSESENWAENPCVYEDKIVWDDGKSIYLYDIKTKSSQKIANASSPKAKIFKDYIVWQSSSPWGGKTAWNIYLYDIHTNKTTAVTKEPYINKNPQIYGNKILWHSNKNGNWDIFLYNIDTKEKKAITVNPADQTFPSIYQNLAVWVDERDSNEEIYFMNLSNTPFFYAKEITPYMNTSSNYRTYLKIFNTNSCAVSMKALLFDLNGNFIDRKKPLDITFNIAPFHSKVIYAKEIKSKALQKGVNISDNFGAVFMYYCKERLIDPNKIFSQVVQKSPLGQRVMPVYEYSKTLTGKGDIIIPHLYQNTSDKHSPYRGFIEFLNIGDSDIKADMKIYLKNGKLYQTSYTLPAHSTKLIRTRELYPKLKIPYGEPLSIIVKIDKELENIYPVVVQKTPSGPRVLEAYKRK